MITRQDKDDYIQRKIDAGWDIRDAIEAWDEVMIEREDERIGNMLRESELPAKEKDWQ